MTALSDLTDLVSSLPNSSLLTDSMKQAALDRSVMPDSSGVWPGQPGYVTTYDIYFAAIALVGFLQAQPVVRQSSSEGTSVSVDAPNWTGLLDYYRSMSPIARSTHASSLLREIPIDMHHVYHTDMASGVNGNDNVDTDLG